MKKFIATILAILYLSTSIGATIQLHYCMGKLVDWRVWSNSSSKCSNCGMEKSHNSVDQGCCKDEFKQIKNEKDQKLSDNFTRLVKTISETSPVITSCNSVSLPVISSSEFSCANAPSRTCLTSLNIIYCIFRI